MSEHAAAGSAPAPIVAATPVAARPVADAQAVNFHIDHPESREVSRIGADDRVVGHPLDTHHRPPQDIELAAQSTRPVTSSRIDGGALNGTLAPGYADDALYGTAHNRGKITHGAAYGQYDEQKHAYHETLPRATFGERLGAGITRPTNLTTGERPMQGKESHGMNDWEHNTYSSVAALPPRHSYWPHFLSLPGFWYPWNVNAQSYRLGQMVTFALCILGTDKRHHRWLWYVILALTIDHLTRVLAGPRASIATLIGDFVDALLSHCRTASAPRGFFPKSIVAGAPYQFSDFCSGIILMCATIAFFDGDEEGNSDTAGAVLLAIQALISFLELFLGFPIFVWFFNQMIHFGLIWKDCEIKAAMIRDEEQRYQASEELRTNAALAQIHDDKHASAPRHMHFAGQGKRALPYSYRSANEYHKRHDWNPFKNIKITHFLVEATIAALAWVWALSSRNGVFGTPDVVWQILIIVAICVFAFHILLYVGKVLFFPGHVMWEWEHPVYRYYFLAPVFAWLLFIPSIRYAGEYTLAEVVYWMGAPLLLFISCIIMANWFHQQHFYDNFSGAWLMVPFTNAIAAYMLTLVHSNYREAAWLWLGISIFIWIILSTLIVFKGAFQPRQHNAHRHQLLLVMGTAFAIAIGLVGIYSADLVQTTADVSAWSQGAVGAFYIGIVLFFIFLVLALQSYFGREHWHVNWWVVPLTMCIASVAFLFYHAQWQSGTTQGMATTALVLTNIAVVLMLGNHIRALLHGQLYRPDTLALSPLEFFRLPNKALREVLFIMQAHVNNPKSTVEEWNHFETVLLPRYQLSTAAFNYVKRGAFYPTLAAWFGPALFAPLTQNARALDDALIVILEQVREAKTLPVNSNERLLADQRIRSEFASYVQGVTANMEEEDAHIFNLARRYIGGKEANAMVRKSWEEVPPSRWAEIVPFIVNFLHNDRLRSRWIECFVHASPEHAQLIGKWCYENLDPFQWDRLVIDHPEIRPRHTAGYSRVW